MKQSRKSVMARKKIEQQLISRKKMATKVNATLALMSASAVMGHVVQPTITVQAKNSVNNKKTTFLNNIAEAAKTIANSNDLYASVMIAQAVLESGWGSSQLSQAPNYNLFGIKGDYEGESVNLDTLEDDGTGNYYKINDGFRKYSNHAESLKDYADLLTGNNDPNNWRYNFYKGARVSTTSSYKDATSYLTGRYATDTAYGNKLNSIIVSNNLTQYDLITRVAETTASQATTVESTTEKTATPQKNSTQPKTETSNTTVVEKLNSVKIKPGDTLFRIAKQHGISVAALQQLNRISGSTIFVGQELVLPANAKIAETTTAQETTSQPVVETIKETTHDTTKDVTTVKENTTMTRNAVTDRSIAPQSMTATTSTSSTASYSIKSGDTLFAIAKKHGVSLLALQKLNGISGGLIYPGQVIKLPGQAQSNVSVASSTATNNQEQRAVSNSANVTVSTASNKDETTVSTQPSAQTSQEGEYTVKLGDTLYSISRKIGVSVNQLIANNGGSTMIYVGQKLHTSSSSSTSVSTNNPVAPATVDVSHSKVETSVSVTTEVTQPVEVIVEQTTTESNSVTPTQVAATYTVNAGDTLYSIAKRNGIDVNQLIAANGSTVIYVGQVIQLNK